MSERPPLFTLFTGCYNSSTTIHRVFESIDHQTLRDFEWIIVNDASKDDTLEKVHTFLSARPQINAKVINHESNKGVTEGRMEALQLARGRYFVTWDHDDIQLPDQLENFQEIWSKYDADNVGAICCCLMDEHGKRVGVEFPADITVSTYFDFYGKYLMGTKKPGQLNERHLCNKTEKFREAVKYFHQQNIITLPELPDGSEVWGMMAFLGNKTIFLNKIVRQYFMEPDRPSMSTDSRSKTAKRVYRDRRVWVNYFVEKLPASDWKIKLRTYLSFCMFGSFSQLGLPKLVGDVDSFKKKLIVILLFIPGKIFHAYLKLFFLKQ